MCPLIATTNFGRGYGGIEVGVRQLLKSGIVGIERVAIKAGATIHF
tara:strand:- start:167 stop:304 length:138 start_codon:yes stop_codon:yes gene_type:complete